MLRFGVFRKTVGIYKSTKPQPLPSSAKVNLPLLIPFVTAQQKHPVISRMTF